MQGLGKNVGKSGVEGGGEGPPALLAVVSRRAAERAFGGDVYRVGLQRIEAARHFGAGSPGQLELAVAGAGEAAKSRGLDHRDLVATRAQPLFQFDQRGDDAVDLRQPGVGDEGELHTTTSTFSAAGSAATTGTATQRRRAAAHAPQSMISRRPSACSTSAVRLSTQSPSLA